MTELTLDDIADLRAYEREREAFRAHIIDLKTRRRVHVGPFVTFVFENRDTIRFQIQEMARAEKILSDEGIETELRIYNPLIPDAGHLSTTLFIELTSDEQLRIERAVELRVGPDAEAIVCTVDPDHDKQLTRDEITASVHYVGFALTPAQVEAFAAGPVALAVTHPAYEHVLELTESTRLELLGDLRGS